MVRNQLRPRGCKPVVSHSRRRYNTDSGLPRGSAALQSDVIHCFGIDVVCKAWLGGSRDEPIGVDGRQIGHPHTQQVLRHHDFCERTIAHAERDVEVGGEIQRRSAIVDLVVQVSVCRVAGGVSPSGSHRSRRDNLSSPGSCHPCRQEPCTHAQWAKSRGCWLVMRCQQALAFLVVRSRLYLLRIQRIT
jgi:hypothetical protein